MKCWPGPGVGGVWVNNPDNRKVIRAFIKSQRVDVVCIQETKIQNMCIGIVHSW